LAKSDRHDAKVKGSWTKVQRYLSKAMKLEIRILIASAFASLSVQAVYSADALDCGKILPKASLLEKAEKVNVLPLALQPSGEETKETDSFKFNKQQQEMADLWDATVARSQDIQFVIQKLMPNNNNGKTAGILLRMMSTAVFGGMGAGMTMMPNMVPNMGSQMSMNCVALTDANLEPSYPVEGGQSPTYLLPAMAKTQGQAEHNGVSSGMGKKARLNETESIMLYTIVRTTAEKLVSDYKDYSQAMHDFADGHDTDDAGMKHALACRGSLVGLAGEEAVTKLDESNGFTKLIKQFEVKSH
jgi:hypothetical protein